MPMVLNALSFLPDSQRTSGIILEAFRQGASPATVWNQRLYERITPADIAAIRDRVLSLDDIEEVGYWEMAVLAAEGSPASQSALEQLAARARRAEATLGRRLLSGCRSHEIDMLVALGLARAETATLLEWGMDAAGQGRTPMGIWAFDEVLGREGPHAPIWDETWMELESRTRERVAEYMTKALAYTGGKSSLKPTGLLLGTWITPWVEWADAHGVAVPRDIRRLTETAYSFPAVTP